MNAAALVLGILSILGSIVGAIWPIGNVVTIIALVVGVIAVILAAIGMKKNEKHGSAVAGLVLGIIAVVLSVIMLIACGGAKSTINNAVNELADSVNNSGTFDEAQAESIANQFVDNLSSELGVDLREELATE